MKDSRSRLFSMIFTGVALVCWCGSSRAEEIPSLTKDVGPFMVLAYSFRGPEAERLARDLALELRKSHDLEAFLYLDPGAKAGKTPEAAVLVGNARTILECRELQQRIKKIEPGSFANTAYQKRGLTKALFTTNPLWPTPLTCTLPRPQKGPVNPH
jgi:hypothetical protein